VIEEETPKPEVIEEVESVDMSPPIAEFLKKIVD
jgi:hypothetical protein